MDDRRDSTRRNSLRYPGYDYTQSGCVFVTICTHRRQRLFGEVVEGEMALSPAGVVVERLLNEIPARVRDVMIDTATVMPDHLHVIVMMASEPEHQSGLGLDDVVHDFKIRVQAAWRRHVASGEWPRYEEKLWQRSYHDRIIRSDRELDAIRDYIIANPARWANGGEP